MRNLFTLSFFVFILLSSLGNVAIAQGTRFNDPLTMQGLDNNTNYSAVSRALGGTTIGIKNDASVMFSDPAGLQNLNSLQVTLGNSYWMLDQSQTQQYGPAKYYPNFSLLMESLTYLIPNPVLDTTTTHTAKDSVQRPFDKIGPNWSRTKNKNLPTQIMAAIPFTIGDYKVVAGLGAVEYANMNYFYQDNNVLSPAINIQRPYPIRLVTSNTDSLSVQWYQNIRNREGELYGYGAAFSFSVNENLTFGLSGLLIKGSTNDFESQLGRGNLMFFSSYFRVDSVDYQNTKNGKSDYSGSEFTFSGLYKSGNMSLGFSIKPPVSISRDYRYTYENELNGTLNTSLISGSDKIKLPWRGSFGLSVSVYDNLRGVIEYELRPMGSANYLSGGITTNPWRSSHLLHIGAEFAPLDWLTFRCGYSDKAEVFEEEGNPFLGDPVTTTIISGGLGLSWENLKLNITYEYFNVKYDDLLQDAVYLNSAKNSYLTLEIAYNLNLLWLK
ncbi:MAG: hypothetical protein P4L35_01325 [Ignavibacteriaceae bacterium]|nr:hypothetical protein [Ignavibacteriaceae bacterium]